MGDMAWAANSGFDQPSMIALASSRIPELGSEVVEGLPTTRESAQIRGSRAIHAAVCSRWHHLFSFAIQFSTMDMGAVSASFTGVMIRNRWPSRLTS